MRHRPPRKHQPQLRRPAHQLTLLAPDIIAAIIDETLQEGVQLLSLAINLPMLWEDQRRWRVAMVN